VCVLGIEWLLVRKAIPNVEQFAAPRPLKMAEGQSEDTLPIIDHDFEQGLTIPSDPAPRGPRQRAFASGIKPPQPFRANTRRQFTLNKGDQPVTE